MDMLIWLGAGVTLVGLALLIWCILRVLAARRSGLSDEALRERLQKVIPVNTGALFLSIFGLMLVVLGIAMG